MTDEDSKSRTIIIAGGGTGGHLYPGIALAQEFEKRRNTSIVFIGTAYGIENKILPQYPYVFKKIAIRGLQRKISLTNLLFPFRFILSLLQCSFILMHYKPVAIIGTGGYVSGPILMTGILFHVPTFIQEQNSYPGLVNRLLGNRVNQVHVTFKASMKYFNKQKNIFVSGNPVRGDFNSLSKSDARQRFHLQHDKCTLFIFGGSQGAHAINQIVLKSLDRLLENENLQILWATGTADFEQIKKRSANSDRVSVQKYIDDMPAAYAAANLAVCRSGASTLSEIAICGLPAILIPYPYSAAGHQVVNAQSVADAGAAVLLQETTLTETSFLSTINDIISNRQKLENMRQAQFKLARPQAAKDIVTAIEQQLTQQNVHAA